MAGGDRRGPQGMGPMTGRGLGYCAGNDGPGYEADLPAAGGRGFGGGRGRGLGPRMGLGRGFGRGFGRGHGFGGGFGRGYGWDHDDYRGEAPRSADTGSSSDLAAELARLREQLAVMEERLASQENTD
ncbi:hypothetical protein DRQ50_00980 [bacterium]|nr:MAG: hypothetical protein DRQ50_00980 [bacterium]